MFEYMKLKTLIAGVVNTGNERSLGAEKSGRLSSARTYRFVLVRDAGLSPPLESR